jgi:hypothetical protein
VYFSVRNLEPPSERLDEFLATLLDLRDEIWQDAEGQVEVVDLSTVWTVVEAREHARFVPVAWCASTVVTAEDGPQMLRCSDNYERRGVGRHYGLYRIAYRHRHLTRVLPLALPAATYLFAQPIPLHEADGWVRTGNAGTSHATTEPHDWWELRREPGST